MPIYEFECLKCGNKFEELVRAADAEIFCPKCHKKELKKLFSAFAFGSGGKNESGSSSKCGGCTAHNCSSCG